MTAHPLIRKLSVIVFAALADSQGLHAQTASEAARLQRLSAQVATADATHSVKRLQWAYGHYSEFGLWYDFADLFADNGIGHYVQGDLNRDQIRALFFDQVGQGKLGLAQGRIYPHISFSPVVDVDADGLHAKGRFRILAMLGGYGGSATWFHGVYENGYVKENGVWKLGEVSNTAQISGSFTAGLSATSKPPLDQPTFALHFTLAQIALLTSTEASPAPMALPALQQRLDQLEDEAAIVRLQHEIGLQLDRHDWDALTAAFAANGTYENGLQGVYVGKPSIHKALALNGSAPLATGEVDEHVMFQTYVSVAADGRTARARVDQVGLQGKQGRSAQWTQGIYENSFVKENGEWRLQSLHYYPRVITDYLKGWGTDAQAAAPPSTVTPPDAPPTETIAVYPAFYIPAFHFPHPVTGRAPQYPPGDAVNTRPVPAQPLMARVAPTSTGTLTTQLDAVEARVKRVLAVDAVENLLNAYAYYLDECQTEQAASLFAAQGHQRIPGIGQYAAPRIARALQLAYCPNGREEATLTIHHALQPVITVSDDGRRATIISKLWQVHASSSDDDYYAFGTLEAEAVLQGSQWKLLSLTPRYSWAGAANQDWTAATVTPAYGAPAAMAAAFPPDAQ